MIYVYAVTDPRVTPARGAGLDGAQLQSTTTAGVRAVYSLHEQLDCAPEPATVWQHELVVEELMAAGAVLPLRFGTTLTDRDALERILARDATRLLASLARVRGCVELAVRLGLPPAPRTPAADGHDYLETIRAVAEERERVVLRALVPLAELASDVRRRQADGVIKASYLVPRGTVEHFAETVRRVQRSYPELELSCTGPWAPYSFSEAAP
jgi:hypothetical protein